MSRTLGDALPDGWQPKFLAALGAGQTISAASELCGVSVGHLYRIRVTDYDFRTAWEAAKQVRRELLAEKAWNVVEAVMDDKGADTKDRLAAARVTIDKAEPDKRLEVHASGEIKFVVESAFTELIAEDAEIEEGDGDTYPAALPGEPETA